MCYTFETIHNGQEVNLTIADYDYHYYGKSAYNRDPEFELDITKVIDEAGNDVTQETTAETDQDLYDQLLAAIREEQEQREDEWEPDYDYELC